MISKQTMLTVVARAMHNPRASRYTVRPLSNKPTPFPFQVDESVLPASVSQFAVEHPDDSLACRIITVAATEYGYAVWCGDKFTQGDLSPLEASLRVELALSGIPSAYEMGARSVMMNLYGSYPHKAPCHFWHAWHHDQGVCKHVAAALQFVERTYPNGVSGLLDSLAEHQNALITAPLLDLVTASIPAKSPGFPSIVADLTNRASRYLRQHSFPYGLQHYGFTTSSEVLKPEVPTKVAPDSVTAPDVSSELLDSSPAEHASSKRSEKSVSTSNCSPEPEPAEFGVPAKGTNVSDTEVLPQPVANAQQSIPKPETLTSRQLGNALAELKKLVPYIAPDVEAALLRVSGNQTSNGSLTVWPLDILVQTNQTIRQLPATFNMSRMLLIGGASDSGEKLLPKSLYQFVLVLDIDGVLRNPEVYRRDLNTQKVDWFAEDLDMYVRRRESEG